MLPSLPLSEQDAELVSLALLMPFCAGGSALFFRWDERRLSEEALESAFLPATRGVATATTVLLSPLAPSLWIALHVARTRRGLGRLWAIPAFLGYVAFVFLVALVIGLVFDAAGVTKP
jgi:hypothetical protein